MNDQQYEKLIDPILKIYDTIESELLIDIAKRFDTYDSVGGTLDWYLKKLEDLGALTKSNIKIIASKSKLTEKEIINLMKKVGYNVSHLPDYKKAYSKNIIKEHPDDLYNSQAIQNVIEQAIITTDDIMKLINTKALESAKKSYMTVLNKAYIEVAGGFKSYNESIKDALIGMAKEGIKGATYKRKNGSIVNYSLEGTVRRDVLTKVRQTAASVSLEINRELNEDLVYVSQHYDARPEHAVWQGKVYSISGTNKKYPPLIESTGYGSIIGLCGVNCRHHIQSYIEGITKIPKKIEVEESEKAYNLVQQQRSMERNVRKKKKELAIAKTTDDEDLIFKKTSQLKDSNNALNDFVNSHKELRRDYSRTSVIDNMSYKEWMSKHENNKLFTSEEKQAFTNYTGFDATKINSALRTGELKEDIIKKRDVLDNAFLKSKPLEKEMIVHRGGLHTNFTIFEDRGSNITDDEMLSLNGRIITDNAFVSTSKVKAETLGRNVIMKIKIPKGFKGAIDIEDYAVKKYKYQKEVLLKRGCNFYVESVTIKDNKYYLDVEVVDYEKRD